MVAFRETANFNDGAKYDGASRVIHAACFLFRVPLQALSGASLKTRFRECAAFMFMGRFVSEHEESPALRFRSATKTTGQEEAKK